MTIKLKFFFIIYIHFLAHINLYCQLSNEVISVCPKQNEIGTAKDVIIEVKYNIALDSSSINDNVFKIFGVNSNIHTGKVIFERENNIIKFIPHENFSAGEVVNICCGPLKSSTGHNINAFQWQFTIGITNKTNAKFKEHVILPLNTSYLQAIDIDINGFIDLVSIEGYVMLNKGNGIFSNPIYEPAYENAVYFRDLNNDTYLDIIKVKYGFSLIFLGDSAGKFQISDSISGDYSSIHSIGDFNCDGFIDLVALGSGWKILFNDGKGHFEEDHLIHVDANCISDIGTSDINNDGIPDNVILVSNPVGCKGDLEGILVYSDYVNGDFISFNKYKAPWQGFLEKLYTADFNNDGYADIAASGITNGGVIFFNNRSGKFITSNSDSGRFSYNERSIYFSAGDMNGDNKIDIILTNNYYYPVGTFDVYGEVQINHGGQISCFNYQDSIEGGEFVIGKNVDLNLTNICNADLDNDGDLDIVHVGYPTIVSFNENILSGICEDNNPHTFSINQNYPNPFNPTTTIIFSIPERSYVELKIFDILGREVINLVSEIREAGIHKVLLDGTHLSSGIYYYELKAGEYKYQVKKMILAK